MNAPVLATPRLSLRPATLGDLAALHALFTDAQVRRWLFDDRVVSEAAAREIIEASTTSFAGRGFGHWVLVEPPGSPLFGCAGLFSADGIEIEILYAVHPSRWGHGFATEAARAVLEHGFRALALPRIAARADTPNVESIRLMERLGMRFEAERPIGGRPTVHYALTREEWERG
ncbi:MAG TPA: GNAT family N-acetyltransferase [Myxococcota bacterium]|nr:GNAT family N-acetyltransferase [Myxococcota bacterium]